MATNGNGVRYRWIATTAVAVIVGLLTVLITLSASGVSTIKEDAAEGRRDIQARLDANTAQDIMVRDAVTRMENDIRWIRETLEKMQKEKP